MATTFFGFTVGERVSSGGDSRGTVVEPEYEVSDEMLERRCVPVIWDRDKHTQTICWTLASSLTKVS